MLGDSSVLQEKDNLLFFSLNEKFMLTAISLKVSVNKMKILITLYLLSRLINFDHFKSAKSFKMKIRQ